MLEDSKLLDLQPHKKCIKEHYKVGEAASAPIDDLPEFRAELKSLIAEYDLNDVYNADETALYWKLEPNKTLSSGPITGTKKPKDRITIMLALFGTNIACTIWNSLRKRYGAYNMGASYLMTSNAVLIAENF
ncbi:1063_t:CDS:2 [Entrophospora sp. SA101]|nr:1063_t:CDS:2 [Entrophospora sp. SA101]